MEDFSGQCPSTPAVAIHFPQIIFPFDACATARGGLKSKTVGISQNLPEPLARLGHMWLKTDFAPSEVLNTVNTTLWVHAGRGAPLLLKPKVLRDRHYSQPIPPAKEQLGACVSPLLDATRTSVAKIAFEVAPHRRHFLHHKLVQPWAPSRCNPAR